MVEFSEEWTTTDFFSSAQHNETLKFSTFLYIFKSGPTFLNNITEGGVIAVRH